ncbi:hypothetical protein DERF_013485 [Dermatophagoides farinae]|uniref:Uncharacterized protein n=1 Tax=Dermatophagoides farinae TaxID=6954 RepID=A0A922HMJ9_DERFA|nr:hypothetical protein DERF_013485 [Dermatophagoides farinae]
MDGKEIHHSVSSPNPSSVPCDGDESILLLRFIWQTTASFVAVVANRVCNSSTTATEAATCR